MGLSQITYSDIIISYQLLIISKKLLIIQKKKGGGHSLMVEL
jgi:hypothetical protein